MTRLTIRIDFDDGSSVGPGKVRMLELVDETGSIRKSAAAMDMSYRKGWLLLKDLEETFGGPLVATATGGSKGGGTSLTAMGRLVIARYRSIEKAATTVTARPMRELAQKVAQKKIK